MSNGTVITRDLVGLVKQYDNKRGFGFIRELDDLYHKVFFHKTEVSYEAVEVGDEVTFDLCLGPKGYFAESVELSNTKPENSESENESEEKEHVIDVNVAGVVQNYNEERAFGFIRVNDTYNKVFFHKTEVSYEDIEAGDHVEFTLCFGSKGYFADCVEYIITPEPENSESENESEEKEHVIDVNVAGVVQNYNEERAFGFIRVNDTYNKVFFHKTEVSYEDIEAGDHVEFTLCFGSKGYFADCVEYIITPEPENSESENESEEKEHVIDVNVAGVVQNYNEERAFGFIRVNDTYNKVFFHKTEVSYEDIEAGDHVEFTLCFGSKGYFADCVEYIITPEPENSESENESEEKEHVIDVNVAGVVQNYNEERAFGFIRVNDTYNKVFFHKTEVSYENIEAGDHVEFTLCFGSKGYFAESVQYGGMGECSEPESEEDLDPEVHLGTDVTGVVKRYLHNRKYGFITVNDTYNTVFFHISDVLYQPVEVGDKVTFDFYRGPKGYFAESVGLVVDPSEDLEDDDVIQSTQCRGCEGSSGPSNKPDGAGKTSSETSRTWREKGNVFFKSACDKKSDDAKVKDFTSARERYEKACASSQNNEDLASAAKNFGTASWKLAKLKMDAGSTDNKMIHSYLKDALQYFSKAYAKRASMGTDWSRHLETSIKKCLDDIRSWIAPRNDDDRIAYLKEYVSYMPECAASVSCHLHIATIIFRKGKDAMKQHEYKKCQRFLDECATPLAEAKRNAGVDPNIGVNVTDLEKDIDELRDMVAKCLSKAEDEQERQKQEQKEADEKATAMKQLKSDLKKLERFKKLPIEDFVKEVYNRWPPKGTHGTKPPCVPASPRKLLIRALSKYHPDKVDKVAHGLKWYLMSGEITKGLNQRLVDAKT